MQWTTFILSFQLLCLATEVVSWRQSWRKYKRIQPYQEMCPAEVKEPWSYNGKNGPKYWGFRYPGCNGKYQSPIAIYSRYAVYDPNLGEIKMFNYHIPVVRATMENNGHSVRVTLMDGVDRALVMQDTAYMLEEVHFHWGESQNKGSEHIIDGIQYALEMHLVHRSTDQQVAVVAVLFKEIISKNPDLHQIIQYFPKVMFNQTRTEASFKLMLDKFLPGDAPYFFHYYGSLTIPGCDEGVAWLVAKQPNSVGKKQIAEFRQLYSTTEEKASSKCKLCNNYRPVQPINDRKVYLTVVNKNELY